jgi:hypothetical protein
MKDIAMIGGVVILVVVLVAIGPLLLIWSLNTLFGLGIAYTLKTWAAALILGGAVTTSSSTSKK